MIILHFDLQPQLKYTNYFMYTSHPPKSVKPVAAMKVLCPEKQRLKESRKENLPHDFCKHI